MPLWARANVAVYVQAAGMCAQPAAACGKPPLPSQARDKAASHAKPFPQALANSDALCDTSQLPTGPVNIVAAPVFAAFPRLSDGAATLGVGSGGAGVLGSSAAAGSAGASAGVNVAVAAPDQFGHAHAGAFALADCTASRYRSNMRCHAFTMNAVGANVFRMHLALTKRVVRLVATDVRTMCM